MPKFDGTGPEGLGPKTGRGMGKCQGANENERGRGRGFGRGPRNNPNCRFAEDATPQERLDALKASKKQIEVEIEALENKQK